MDTIRICLFALSIVIIGAFFSCTKDNYTQPASLSDNADAQATDRASAYTMPSEGATHEGTWLQFPHEYQYGTSYRNRLIDTWVAMTKELVTSEKVHIIAYNNTHKNWIISKLNAAGVPLSQVDFHIFQTNDVWVRDNGPIFVRNAQGAQSVLDWGFNGWGGKAPFAKCNPIPQKVGSAIGKPVVNLNTTMKLEGGAFEVDGNGTFLATRSSILNANRNLGMTQAQAESILANQLGITKFIWLNGVPGLEITDMHIDGFARFGNPNIIVTMNAANLLAWDVSQADINTLYAATKPNGTPFQFVHLPLTQYDVKTAYGKNLGYKGSYVNYYESNTKVLIPKYNDPNDNLAKSILQSLYPTKTVVQIDVRNLYEWGGMVHCVTQQQPL